MKLKNYVISQILTDIQDLNVRDYLDKIKLELDWRIYHYGANFSIPFENSVLQTSYKNRIYDLKNKLVLITKQKKITQNRVVSSVYFNNFDKHLGIFGEVYSPVWLPRGMAIDGNLSLYDKAGRITRLLQKASVRELLEEQTQSLLNSYEEELLNYYRDTNPFAVFLFTDQYYHSKVLIEVFKKINKKSYILSHGLPGIYSTQVDNRSDYIFVWGQKIKNNYIKAGFQADKIFVTGHPGYTTLPEKSFRNSFDNVLVLPKSMAWHQHTYDPVVSDRGAIIVYLLSLQKVLKKLGIRSVRLRPHPSASVQWLISFLDPTFFIADPYPQLSQSLAQSSLVVGPTSTVFLESLIYGVNYVIYEPQDDEGIDLLNYKIVAPFDGSDPEIPVAKTESELEELLSKKQCQQNDILSGYLTPFNEDLLKDSVHSTSLHV